MMKLALLATAVVLALVSTGAHAAINKDRVNALPGKGQTHADMGRVSGGGGARMEAKRACVLVTSNAHETLLFRTVTRRCSRTYARAPSHHFSHFSRYFVTLSLLFFFFLNCPSLPFFFFPSCIAFLSLLRLCLVSFLLSLLPFFLFLFLGFWFMVPCCL